MLARLMGLSYTVGMVKQTTKTTVKKAAPKKTAATTTKKPVAKKAVKTVTHQAVKPVIDPDFSPNKMGFAVAALAATSLVLLGVIAMYS